MLPDSIRLLGQKWIAAQPWYLAPLSVVYALAVWIRNAFYDLGVFSITRAPCTVVSIGNIVAGGSGKTPFVHFLASAFSHRKVAILSRGYGSIPDEALLLAKKLPSVSVFVHKNRAELAKQIGKDFDLILLDDGLQHRKLYRDFDVVLNRMQKEHYLPWGFLRDSPKRLRHATVFEESEWAFSVRRILKLNGEEIPSIRGKNVTLFCAIARPERFRKTVEALGAHVEKEVHFADHGKIDLARLPPADLYLCTEKDAVKLPKTTLPILYLEMQVIVGEGHEKMEKLIAKIDQKIDNGSFYE